MGDNGTKRILFLAAVFLPACTAFAGLFNGSSDAPPATTPSDGGDETSATGGDAGVRDIDATPPVDDGGGDADAGPIAPPPPPRFCTVHNTAVFCADFDAPLDAGGNRINGVEFTAWKLPSLNMAQVSSAPFDGGSPPTAFGLGIPNMGYGQLTSPNTLSLSGTPAVVAATVTLLFELEALPKTSEVNITELDFTGSDVYEIRISANGISAYTATTGTNYMQLAPGIHQLSLRIVTPLAGGNPMTNVAASIDGMLTPFASTDLTVISNSFTLNIGAMPSGDPLTSTFKIAFDSVLVTP
jgi:hypothetical protein